MSDADKLDLDDYDIESPKFLADIFESVAGAIYLDSNCSLDAVWKSYFPLMEPYLGNSLEKKTKKKLSKLLKTINF